MYGLDKGMLGKACRFPKKYLTFISIYAKTCRRERVDITSSLLFDIKKKGKKMKETRRSRASPALRVLPGCIFGLMLLGSPGIVSAEEMTPWETMHAGAYPPTIEAAHGQCLDGGLSTETCDQFAQMLQQEQCQPVEVQDGARYDWMGGPGGISHSLQKQLGEDTPAWECQVQEVTLHWYQGFTDACNNVGLYRGPLRTFGRETIRTESKRYGYRPAINICGSCVLPGGLIELPNRLRIESAPGHQLVPPHIR